MHLLFLTLHRTQNSRPAREAQFGVKCSEPHFPCLQLPRDRMLPITAGLVTNPWQGVCKGGSAKTQIRLRVSGQNPTDLSTFPCILLNPSPAREQVGAGEWQRLVCRVALILSVTGCR